MVWEKDTQNAGFSNGTPWLPVKPPQAAKSVDHQTPDGILAYYKEMIAYRKNSLALSRGTTNFISLPEPLLAFTRTGDTQALTCIFNLSADEHTISLKNATEIAVGHGARVTGETLVLDGNGFAYLSHGAKPPL
jgi:alpha-glucosidase